jgi:hypothetical protein
MKMKPTLYFLLLALLSVLRAHAAPDKLDELVSLSLVKPLSPKGARAILVVLHIRNERSDRPFVTLKEESWKPLATVTLLGKTFKKQSNGAQAMEIEMKIYELDVLFKGRKAIGRNYFEHVPEEIEVREVVLDGIQE